MKVISLIGLPKIGKSFFCQKLEKNISNIEIISIDNIYINYFNKKYNSKFKNYNDYLEFKLKNKLKIDNDLYNKAINKVNNLIIKQLKIKKSKKTLIINDLEKNYKRFEKIILNEITKNIE